MKTQRELRKALAQIMETAKNHRDLSEDRESRRWEAIVTICNDALDNPTVADIWADVNLKPRQRRT